MDQDVPPTPSHVLLVLANYADQDGVCWPSVATIARKTRLSERGVQKALRVLEGEGLIAAQPDRRVLGRGSSIRYRLQLRKGAPDSPITAERVNDVHPDDGSRGERGSEKGEPRSGKGERGAPKPSRTIKNHQLPPIPPASRGAGARKAFERFWAKYPRKVAQAAARREWDKAIANGADPEDIIDGVIVATSMAWLDMREGGRFCPHPSSWLRSARWLDNLEPDAEPEADPAAAEARH
tara:strand:- start:4268 stop:4981 length:714 start_codon:yes stop_codon:yes gene_type:complete